MFTTNAKKEQHKSSGTLAVHKMMMIDPNFHNSIQEAV